jgi:hypothetical protein
MTTREELIDAGLIVPDADVPPRLRVAADVPVCRLDDIGRNAAARIMRGGEERPELLRPTRRRAKKR